MKISASRSVPSAFKVFAFASVLFIQAAHAAPMLDQSSGAPPSLDGNMCGSFPGCVWEQQVTPGLTGTLAGIQLYGVGNTNVRIGLGPSPWTGSWSPPLSGPANGTYIDLSSLGISVTSGTPFAFQVWGAESYTYGTARPYPGGHTFLVQFPPDPGSVPWDLTANNGSINIAFQTYVEPAAAPAPGALALLSFGVLGVATLRRPKRSSPTFSDQLEFT